MTKTIQEYQVTTTNEDLLSVTVLDQVQVGCDKILESLVSLSSVLLFLRVLTALHPPPHTDLTYPLPLFLFNPPACLGRTWPYRHVSRPFHLYR